MGVIKPARRFHSQPKSPIAYVISQVSSFKNEQEIVQYPPPIQSPQSSVLN